MDTPKTGFVNLAADLERGAGEIGFPAIVKPVESLTFRLSFHRHVPRIESRGELASAYERAGDCGTLMILEIVPGGGDELFTPGSSLDAESRVLPAFTGHELRRHPPVFGRCRMAVSVRAPEMAEPGVRSPQERGYHGVSQVEFKRGARNGRYRLMEIDARHWMWHAPATDAGVILSDAAYADAVGTRTAMRRGKAPRAEEG